MSEEEHIGNSPFAWLKGATRGGLTTPFWLTRTEREVSMERPADWRLYRLHDLSASPGLFVLPPPLEHSVTLEAETWRARFG